MMHAGAAAGRRQVLTARAEVEPVMRMQQRLSAPPPWLDFHINGVLPTASRADLPDAGEVTWTAIVGFAEGDVHADIRSSASDAGQRFQRLAVMGNTTPPCSATSCSDGADASFLHHFDRGRWS